MAIVMVGPYPGPFTRTHYSDSSSEGAPLPQQQQQPEFVTAQQCTQYVPFDDVTYSPAQPDSAAPVPVYTPMHQELPMYTRLSMYQELPMYQQLPAPPPEPAPKPWSVALVTRMWKPQLCRVGAVAVMMAVVALVAVAVTAPSGEHPEVAPVKPVGVAKAANVSHGKGTTGPRRNSKGAPPPMVRTSPNTPAGLPGRSVGAVAGLAGQTPREDRGTHDVPKPVDIAKAANITQSKGTTGPRLRKKAPPSTVRTSLGTEEGLGGRSAVAGLAGQTPREDSGTHDVRKPVDIAKAANITQSKGTTGPRLRKKAPPSTVRTSPGTEEGLGGRSAFAGLAEQTPREDSGVDARKTLPEMTSTPEPTRPTTSTDTASVVPHDTAPQGESESTTLAQRTTAATSAAEAHTHMSTIAATVTTTMARTAQVVTESSGVASTDVGVHRTDVVGLSRTVSDTAGSPAVTSSPAPSPPSWSTVTSVSQPAMPTSTTDIAEVIGGTDATTDVQEV